MLVYIGDGSWGEGAVYEALNMASLWQLPVVVAVENNGIAQTTRITSHLAGSIGKRAAAFGIRYRRVASADVNEIRSSVAVDLREAAELAAVKARDWYAAYREKYPGQFARLDTEQRLLMARVVEEVRAAPRAS